MEGQKAVAVAKVAASVAVRGPAARAAGEKAAALSAVVAQAAASKVAVASAVVARMVVGSASAAAARQVPWECLAGRTGMVPLVFAEGEVVDERVAKKRVNLVAGLVVVERLAAVQAAPRVLTAGLVTASEGVLVNFPLEASKVAPAWEGMQEVSLRRCPPRPRHRRRCRLHRCRRFRLHRCRLHRCPRCRLHSCRRSTLPPAAFTAAAFTAAAAATLPPPLPPSPLPPLPPSPRPAAAACRLHRCRRCRRFRPRRCHSLHQARTVVPLPIHCLARWRV